MVPDQQGKLSSRSSGIDTVSIEDVAAWMPARDDRRRRALVVGGGWMHHGDPVLAGLAALYSGVGDVYVAVPGKIADSVRCLSADLHVIPLPDQKLTRGAAAWIADHVRGLDAAYLGANFRDAGGALQLARELASRGTKLVLESAGARREVLDGLAGRRFIAIYDGETFARAFTGASPDRESVKEAAAAIGGTVLVRDGSAIASDGRTSIVSAAGPPAEPAGVQSLVGGLATGLLSLGMDELRSAAAAAFIIGVAGDAISGRRGFHWGASALLEELPGVLVRFDFVGP